MSKFIISLLLLVSICFSLTTITTTCSDSNTLLKNMTNGSQTTMEYSGCQYGCDNGICIDNSQTINYLFSFIVVFAIIIVASLVFFIKTDSAKNPLYKTVIFMLLLILLIVFSLIVGNIGTSIGETNGVVLQTLALVFSFLLLGFLAFFVIDIFKSRNKARNASEDDDDDE